MTGGASFIRPTVIGAVVVHPSLWWTALRQGARMAPRGWWRRFPFLPVPPADYLEFRLVTQYGGDVASLNTALRGADVVDYLRWCKEWNARR